MKPDYITREQPLQPFGVRLAHRWREPTAVAMGLFRNHRDYLDRMLEEHGVVVVANDFIEPDRKYEIPYSRDFPGRYAMHGVLDPWLAGEQKQSFWTGEGSYDVLHQLRNSESGSGLPIWYADVDSVHPALKRLFKEKPWLQTEVADDDDHQFVSQGFERLNQWLSGIGTTDSDWHTFEMAYRAKSEHPWIATLDRELSSKLEGEVLRLPLTQGDTHIAHPHGIVRSMRKGHTNGTIVTVNYI